MDEKVNKTPLLEVIIVTSALVLLTSGLHTLQSIPFVNEYFSLIFAVLFLYAPVLLIHRRGQKIDFLDKNPIQFLKSILLFFVVSIIVFPPFFLGAYFWMMIFHGTTKINIVPMPEMWSVVAYQLLMIALPEEFFFRGYFQGALTQRFAPKWKILGVRLGWGWILTAAIFAAAHSIVSLQWWHFAIFFPALLFGYLKERTGSITAPILFHALSNIIMNWIPYLFVK